MTQTINKKFLENVKLSNLPLAWSVQARGFYYSAEALLNGNEIAKGKKIISTEEAYLSRFGYKTACYLMSHTIELCLKAIYCLFTANEDVEKYSHKILNLLEVLIEKNIINKTEINNETFELSYLLLDWYGRYHKPKNVQEKIQKYWITAPDNSEMLKRKYEINSETYKRLKEMAQFLLRKIPDSSKSIGLLIFDPF